MRLRREICWRWHQQGASPTTGTLPPLTDRLTESLNLTRYWEKKQNFYQSDVTAKYLTEKLLAESPSPEQPTVQGSFAWVVEALNLDEISAFTLALGLATSFDSAASEVIAACLNDPAATHPTLALAQKLWDRPEEVLAIADLAHPLWRYGLLQPLQDTQRGNSVDWHGPLTVPPLVANRLLFLHSPLPQILAPLAAATEEIMPLSDSAKLVASRLSFSQTADELRIVPVRGPNGALPVETIRGIAQVAQRKVVELRGDPVLWENSGYFKSLATLCWLAGLDLYLSGKGIDGHEGESNRPHKGRLFTIKFW